METQTEHGQPGSRWLGFLVAAWVLLGIRMIVALARHQSLAGNDTLTFELFAFAIVTAILGSRVYLVWDTRRHAHG